MTRALLRLGLCCKFIEEPIKFRSATAAHLLKFPRGEQLIRIGEIAAHNAAALLASLEYCARSGIGSFRVMSQILPMKTHPKVGYQMKDIPGGQEIIAAFRGCGDFAKAMNIRTGFHPDQFVVLNSPDSGIVERSVLELEYQAEVAEWIGADTLNIHGGGAYGDKALALEAFRRNLALLSDRARNRLTLENDDKTYTPEDLLPVCCAEGIPLVYDVHHHRCAPDSLSIQEATDAARKTWHRREPLFHLSSPIEGWKGPHCSRHHDYIDPQDFPKAWLGWHLTVEVEAKAKELAVAQLAKALGRKKS
ncbi:MAG: UV DNA damage repair endonuclease UvsE [Chthoniobacteraceae bacterium]